MPVVAIHQGLATPEPRSVGLVVVPILELKHQFETSFDCASVTYFGEAFQEWLFNCSDLRLAVLVQRRLEVRRDAWLGRQTDAAHAGAVWTRMVLLLLVTQWMMMYYGLPPGLSMTVAMDLDYSGPVAAGRQSHAADAGVGSRSRRGKQ